MSVGQHQNFKNPPFCLSIKKICCFKSFWFPVISFPITQCHSYCLYTSLSALLVLVSLHRLAFLFGRHINLCKNQLVVNLLAPEWAPTLEVLQAEHTRGRGFLLYRSAPTFSCPTSAANEGGLVPVPVLVLLPSTTGPRGTVGIRERT